MMKKTLVSLAAALTFSSSAFGISRIGNALIGSDYSGFETVLPEFFVAEDPVKPTPNIDVPLLLRTDTNSGDPEELLIMSFKQFAPFTWVNDKNESEEKLSMLAPGFDWQEIKSIECCPRLFLGRKDKVLLGVGIWGPRRGVVFKGANQPLTELGVRQMLEELTLRQGACLWR